MTWKETEVAEDLVDGEPAVRLVVLLLHHHLLVQAKLDAQPAETCHLGDKHAEGDEETRSPHLPAGRSSRPPRQS